jgi:hypothetical protein
MRTFDGHRSDHQLLDGTGLIKLLARHDGSDRVVAVHTTHHP